MKVYVAAFPVRLRRERLLIDIRQPDEEYCQRPKRDRIAANKDGISGFGYLKAALDSRVANHLVFPNDRGIVRQL